MQVCRICLATDCKLYSMTAKKMLCRAYETLTGLSMENDVMLSPYMCGECSRRLLNWVRFRSRSIKSHLILLEVVKKHHCITPELLQSVVGLQSSYISHNETEQYNLDIELLEKENVYNEEGADQRELPGSRKGFVVDVIKIENDDVNPDYRNGETTTDVPVDMSNLDSGISVVVKEENDDIINRDIPNEDIYNSVGVDISKVHGEFTIEVKTESNEIIVPEILNKDTTNRDAVDDKTENDELINSDILDEASPIDEIHKDTVDIVKAEKVDVTYHESDGKELINIHGVHGNEFDGEDYSSKNGLTVDVRKKAKPRTKKVLEGFKVTGHLDHTMADTHQTPQADRVFTNKKISCDVCSYQTTNATQLLSHLKTHAATTSINYRKFSKETIAEIRLHSGEKSFLCNVCNTAFDRMFDLEAHLRIHIDKKPYSCNVCSKVFIRKSHLKTHLRTHTTEKLYTCNLCNKAFNTKVYLQAHSRIHSGIKPYSCNVCNKAFIRKADLEKHFRKHTGEKPYSCNVCQKSYKGQSDLRIHMRIHTGNKPYPCNICNKAYNKKFELQEHLRTHTGEKPFSCDICNKAFFRKGELQKHLRIHTDAEDKPYPCNVCDKSFIRKADLQRHLRIHTREKPS